MKEKFAKSLVIPFTMGMLIPTINIPNTRVIAPKPTDVPGSVIYQTSTWDNVEYARLQDIVMTAIRLNAGQVIENLVVKLAEVVQRAIPGRTFTVTIGTFVVSYKAEEVKEDLPKE